MLCTSSHMGSGSALIRMRCRSSRVKAMRNVMTSLRTHEPGAAMPPPARRHTRRGWDEWVKSRGAAEPSSRTGRHCDMSRSRMIAVVCAAVAVVGVLSWSPGGGAQAAEARAAAQSRLVTLSFNMCGNKCNDGRLGIADHVADAVLHRPSRPKSVALQEVCARQAQRIAPRLAGTGYHVKHVPPTHRCDDGSRDGIALAYHGDAAWTRVYDPPHPRRPQAAQTGSRQQ